LNTFIIFLICFLSLGWCKIMKLSIRCHESLAFRHTLRCG
jgi:hypothetical protein